MATASLIPPCISLSTINHLPLPHLCRFGIRTRTSTHKKRCRLLEKMVARSSNQVNPSLQNELCLRRDMMLLGLSCSFAVILPPSGYCTAEEVKMAPIVDDINSYSYLCPLELPKKKLQFKWVQSREPERYSSAAPLSHFCFLRASADARLRIVSERVDIIDNLIISITIGPPNKKVLKSKDKSTWTAKDVADSVLSDKSALRVTSSQRMAESSVLGSHSSEIEGEPYWYYEYLVRKSPTKTVQDSSIFRHYVSSTAERDGYLYSISASTLNKQWNVMGPALEQTAASFRLLPPTEKYVPPYKDPWRFW